MYEGMRYTTPVASLESVLGFTLVRRDLSVLPDQNIINSDANLGADSPDLLADFSDVRYGAYCFGVILFHVILLPDVHPFLDIDRWIAVVLE